MVDQTTSLERRENRRYHLNLPIRYRVSERGGMPYTGSGMMCDMSTTGLSFRCRRVLPLGAHIEMTVEWPSRDAAGCPMELQVTGFVVRLDRGRAGVRVTSHRFRSEAAPALAMGATA